MWWIDIFNFNYRLRLLCGETVEMCGRRGVYALENQGANLEWIFCRLNFKPVFGKIAANLHLKRINGA